MKAASGAMIALLNSATELLIADLLTITTAGGSIYRYTSADVDIKYGGNTFTSHDMRFKRGKIRTVIGITVDEMDLEIYADSTNLIGSVPFFQALVTGALDWARVQVDHAVMSVWGDTTPGTIIGFSGRIADITLGRSAAQLKIKSDLELLSITMPRNVYQPACIHTLYDGGCLLNKASFAISGIVASGSTTSLINATLGQATGYFDLGEITFTSGVNTGVTRNVKKFTSGSPAAIQLSYPLLNAPGIGDAFTIYPGCDHQQATCTNKFSNLVHFRGFPYVPLPEAAV